MNNIELEGSKEELETSLLEAQNNLENLKENFDQEKILKREFDQQTQYWKNELEEVQRSIDILESLED